MPLPTRRKGEKQQDFVGRCMGSDTMKKEYPDQEQRAAICYSQARRRSRNNVRQNIRVPLMANVATRQMEWEGKQWLVVPVVALVEGVHSGSGGPTYYPRDELAKFVEAWNGRPVPVFHPERNGYPISCNDPDVIARQSVGQTFNFRMDGPKLKGEVWIDIEKANRIDPQLLTMIHENLEISTGLFGEEDGMPGSWNGEHYDTTLYNYRPDHLALLPEGTGACSWADGCGVRANEKKGNNMKSFREKFVDWAEQTPNILTAFVHNEASHEEIRRKLQQKIDTLDNPQKVHFIRAVYDNYFVYMEENMAANQPSKLWKQSYTIENNGEVKLGDEVQQVEEQTSFVALNANNQQKEGEEKMERTKSNAKPCCEERVQMLIENERTRFTDDDREWLLSLNEEQLAKMEPAEEKAAPPASAKEGEDKSAVAAAAEAGFQNALDGKDVKGGKPKTAQEYVNEAPPEIKEVLEHSLQMHDNKRQELVKGILANSRNKFTEAQLKAKNVSELEAIAALAGERDFSLQGGSQHEMFVDNSGAGEPLEAPTINWMKNPNQAAAGK